MVGEGEVITADHGLDKIPLYVTDGGIVPMIPASNNTKKWSEGLPLEIRVYGHKPKEYILYDDNGQTFDYEKGAYSQQLLKVIETSGGLKGSVIPITLEGGWSYKDVSWKFMGR